MSITQVGMYHYFISQVDWDKDHTNYSLLLPNDQTMASSLKLSYATIHKHRKELTEKKFLVNERGTVKVPNYYMFEIPIAYSVARLPLEKLQELIVNPQTPFEEVQKLIDNLPPDQAQKQPKGFNNSFKRTVSSSDKEQAQPSDPGREVVQQAIENGDSDLSSWFESEGMVNTKV
jgi:hypothetical protein